MEDQIITPIEITEELIRRLIKGRMKISARGEELLETKHLVGIGWNEKYMLINYLHNGCSPRSIKTDIFNAEITLKTDGSLEIKNNLGGLMILSE